MQTAKSYLCHWALLATLTALGVAQPNTAPTAEPPSPDGTNASATQAINTFGLKLVTDVAAGEKHRNVFVSPLSVFAAMAMAETGAAGKTQKEIRQALSVSPSMSEDTLHQSISALLKSLQSQKGVELSIANALWSNQRWPLAARFVQQCHKFYEAQATTLDFTQPSSVANTINNWVKEKTKGKIPEIVSPAAVREAKAILTNAVYFKGGWTYIFDKDLTKPGTFHLADGKEKQVPLMHQSSIKEAYRSGEGFEAAALPYENSEMVMYAILPAPDKSPEEILDGISIEKLRNASELNELDLRLPRFALDFSAALKTTLEHMGMSAAFQMGAEFGPMGSPNFYIGDVLHRTRLEVDEKGTVAAAATAVGVLGGVMMPRPILKKVLVFDRPFAILLCDARTGTILFAGVIYEP